MNFAGRARANLAGGNLARGDGRQFHFHGLTTLQPARSNGSVSRVTTRQPREREMTAISESRKGSGDFVRPVISPQMAAARASKFRTRYWRGSAVAKFLMRS